MVYVGEEKPVDNQHVSWRDISQMDIKIIESLVERVRIFSVGAKFRQVDWGIFSKNALDQAVILQEAVKQIYRRYNLSGQDAIPSWQAVSTKIQDEKLAALNKGIKNKRSMLYARYVSNEKRISTVLAQLQTIIKNASKLNNSSTLYDANKAFQKLDHATHSRLCSYDDKPLDKFLETITKNMPAFRRDLSELFELYKEGDGAETSMVT